MFTLQSRDMTPAGIEARRRNGLKSTGPRTARGKAQSRLNALRRDFFTPTDSKLWRGLLDVPPGYPVAITLNAFLSAEEYCDPISSDRAKIHLNREEYDSRRIAQTPARKPLREPKQTQEAIENNRSSKCTLAKAYDLIENKHLILSRPVSKKIQ